MASQAVLVEAPQQAERHETKKADAPAGERPVAVPVDQLPPVCVLPTSFVCDVASSETDAEELTRQVKAAVAGHMEDIIAALRDGQVVEIVPSHAVLSPQMASRLFLSDLGILLDRMKSGIIPTTVLDNDHHTVTFHDMIYDTEVTERKEIREIMRRHIEMAVEAGCVD